MYQVFNTIKGQYIQANSLDDAKNLYHQIINDYFVYQNLFQGLPTDEYFINNQLIANEFCAIHYGNPNATYLYSVYNTATKEMISQVFGCDGDLIKVSNNEISEWYKANYSLNGINHVFVSININTNDPIDYYDWAINQAGSVMNKYDLNGQFIVSTNFTPIPQDKIYLLDGFEYINTITGWSDKYYGFCVEYLGLINIAYADCTPEQQAELNAQKMQFIKDNDQLFVVNEESIDDQGNSTWTVVDTSNWY